MTDEGFLVHIAPSATVTIGVVAAVAIIPLFFWLILALLTQRPLFQPYIFSVIGFGGVNTTLLLVGFVKGSISYQTPGAIALHTPLTQAAFKFSEISINQAVALSEVDEGGRLSTRQLGVALPGFSSGWFRTAKGRSVFVLYTHEDGYLIPTKTDADFVLDKEQMLALKSRMSPKVQ